MALRCDMRFEKGERKKVRPKVGSNRWSIASKRHDLWFTICATRADDFIGSAVLLVVLPVPWLTDVVQSAVSNLFPNQWRCLKLYLPLPVCLICRCVFWLVILFSNLSLCFLNCYFVFIFAFAFVICYFVFRIVFCFALVGHRKSVKTFQCRV